VAVWKYNNAHDTYPVKAGDVWKVGVHTLVCGDLEGETKLDAQVEKLKPDFIYTDPPWNNGNGKAFRTKAGVDGDQGRNVDIRKLIKRVLTFGYKLKVLTFCEGGKKERAINRAIINELYANLIAEWDITYTERKLPCVLFAADWRKAYTNDYPDFTGMTEWDVETLALSHYKPRLVLDPCGGLGGTAWAAHRTGCASLTSELSPYRMAVALQRLHQLTGIQPTFTNE